MIQRCYFKSKRFIIVITLILSKTCSDVNTAAYRCYLRQVWRQAGRAPADVGGAPPSAPDAHEPLSIATPCPRRIPDAPLVTSLVNHTTIKPELSIEKSLFHNSQRFLIKYFAIGNVFSLAACQKHKI